LPVWAAVLPFLLLLVFLAAFCGRLFQGIELRMSLLVVVDVTTDADDDRTLETDPRLTSTRIVSNRRTMLFDCGIAVRAVDLHSRK